MLQQGDKWMRLPSTTYDTNDLIRSLSIADGPEEVIDAEEYLHPQPPEVTDSPQSKVGVSLIANLFFRLKVTDMPLVYFSTFSMLRSSFVHCVLHNLCHLRVSPYHAPYLYP